MPTAKDSPEAAPKFNQTLAYLAYLNGSAVQAEKDYRRKLAEIEALFLREPFKGETTNQLAQQVLDFIKEHMEQVAKTRRQSAHLFTIGEYDDDRPISMGAPALPPASELTSVARAVIDSINAVKGLRAQIVWAWSTGVGIDGGRFTLQIDF